MITVKYKSYNELSINKFFELNTKMNEAEDNELDKLVVTLSVLCDTDENSIYSLSIGEITELKEQIEWLTIAPDFDKTKEFKTIELPDFGKCNIDTKLKHFTISQYIDFQAFYKLADEHPEYLLSVFVLPDKHNYNDGYDQDELINSLANNIDIITARELTFFILKRLVNSIVSTLTFLEAQMKAKKVLTWNKEKKKIIAEKIEELKDMKEAIRLLGFV